MADFRVTDKDRYEFNAWIKGRMKDEPRLKQYFKDEDEYEEFMLTYEQTHINLDNDPAVIQKQYSETPGNVVECSWDEGVYNGKYYDFLFIRDDGEQLRFQNSEYGDDEFPAIVTVVGGKAYLAKLETGFFSETLNEYMIKYKFKNERDEWSEDFQIYIGSSEKEVRELFNKNWVAGDKPLDKLGEVSISLLRENISNKMFSDRQKVSDEKTYSSDDDLYYYPAYIDFLPLIKKYRSKHPRPGLRDIKRALDKAWEVVTENKSFSDRQKVSAADLEKAKSEGVVQKKPNGKWGIISIDAEEWWNADYNTKESAENALKAYHANKGFSIIDDSQTPGTNAWYYIGQVLDSIEFMHKVHLITTDYAAHKALNDYYEDMPELIDKFAEDLLSQVPANAEYNVELFGDHSFIYTQCPIEYLETLMEYEKSLRLKYKGFTPAQLSELDAVSGLMESTLYQLKRLAIHKNRTFSFK